MWETYVVHSTYVPTHVPTTLLKPNLMYKTMYLHRYNYAKLSQAKLSYTMLSQAKLS